MYLVISKSAYDAVLAYYHMKAINMYLELGKNDLFNQKLLSFSPNLVI